MKSKLILALTVFGLAFNVQAADKKEKEHDHDHEHQAGPTGGRLITEVEPHAEFFVTADKKVEIRFVDDHNKVVAPGQQAVSVTLGERSAPTILAFAKMGEKLVSDKMIPEGNNHPTVVQIREAPGAKAVIEKFNLNLEKCPTCKYLEYACICDHAHEHEHEKDGKKEKK